ncbi:MAG: FtsX-like permease family protein, partial [Bryobacteraceae bacterium]
LRVEGLTEEPSNVVYVPHSQNSWNTLAFEVRTQGDPNAMIASVRREIWNLDPKLAISGIKTMDQIMNEELARPRFSMFLLGLFAVVALLLAAVGIYGVMAYSVAQRTREIGIRMALGASRGAVLRMVGLRGAVLATVGVVLGTVGALALTRLMRGLLFGVSPVDPATFVTVCVVLSAVTILACYLPVRRATRIDPVNTLRYE